MAFENCKQLLKSSNIDSNVAHKVQLDPFMYAIVSLEEPIPLRYAYTCPCNTCNLKEFFFLCILHVSFVRVVINLLAILMFLHLLIRLTYLVVYHTIHSDIMHPIFIIDLIILEFETVILMYFCLLGLFLFLLFIYPIIHWLYLLLDNFRNLRLS